MKDVLKDRQYPDTGTELFKIAEDVMTQEETIILNMAGVETVPTVFMPTSGSGSRIITQEPSMRMATRPF